MKAKLSFCTPLMHSHDDLYYNTELTNICLIRSEQTSRTKTARSVSPGEELKKNGAFAARELGKVNSNNDKAKDQAESAKNKDRNKRPEEDQDKPEKAAEEKPKKPYGVKHFFEQLGNILKGKYLTKFDNPPRHYNEATNKYKTEENCGKQKRGYEPQVDESCWMRKTLTKEPKPAKESPDDGEKPTPWMRKTLIKEPKPAKDLPDDIAGIPKQTIEALMSKHGITKDGLNSDISDLLEAHLPQLKPKGPVPQDSPRLEKRVRRDDAGSLEESKEAERTLKTGAVAEKVQSESRGKAGCPKAARSSVSRVRRGLVRRRRSY